VILKVIKDDVNKLPYVYLTAQFERCLADLRKKGGTASDAAERIDVFIQNLMRNGNGTGREQFRYTRNGEYRIRHCKKISLGCGYRLVLIKKTVAAFSCTQALMMIVSGE